MIGRLHAIVIDCPEPRALAHFYQELLGLHRVVDEADWVVIGDSHDRFGLAFARVEDYRPPTWPEGPRPQYRHFDVAVADLATAEDQVVRLGGRPTAGGGDHFRVCTDPVGHPFCLVVLS